MLLDAMREKGGGGGGKHIPWCSPCPGRAAGEMNPITHLSCMSQSSPFCSLFSQKERERGRAKSRDAGGSRKVGKWDEIWTRIAF